MDYKIKRLARREVYRGSLLTFYEDTMELPDGRKTFWDYIQHPKNGACVVPVLPDGRILMIRQYRPVIDRETLELPAGARDYIDDAGMSPDSSGKPGIERKLEDPAVTAARELREETGYTAGKISFLLRLKTAVAWCSETTDVYLAEDLRPGGEQELDEAEEIRTEPHDLSELLKMIREGKIEDGKTAAGLLAYADRVRNR